MNKNITHMILFGAVLLACAIGGYLYWQHNTLYPSTDDAYVNAHVVNIAAQVTGPVTQTYVSDYQLVKKDQPLFDIDPKPFMIAVQKAAAALNLAEQHVAGDIASVKAATADVAKQRNALILAEQNAHRMLPLVRTGQIAKAQGDKITEQLNIARASLQASVQNLEKAKSELGAPNKNNANIQNAKADFAQAKLNLQHTHIIAPHAGRLINFTTRTGDMINQGVDLFSLIEQKNWWVDANFKETQLQRIRINQPVNVYVDIYPNYIFKGLVTHISQGSGSAFSLLPAENATGNWVKVTQRFPVKIKIINVDASHPLRVGASAQVTVNTTAIRSDNSPAASIVRQRSVIHH